MKVSQVQGDVGDISDISKTYDGKAVEKPTFTTINDRGTNDSNVTIEYKEKDADDSTYTTVKPVNAGDYVVRVTLKADGDHEEVSDTAEFRIAPAEITVSVINAEKHIGEDDPAFAYHITQGLLAQGDTLEGITLSRVEGETAGDYVISVAGQSTSNLNYNITYASGKLNIADHTVVTDAAVAATCTKAGLTEGSHCSVCNKGLVAQQEVPALGHDWSGEWTVIKEATATEEGKEETICTRGCGQKKIKAIPEASSTDDSFLQKDVEVAPEAPIEEASLDNEKSELLNAPAIFSEAEKQTVESGSNARVWLEVTKTDEDSMSVEDKEKVIEEAENILGENPAITYFDVDLFKQIEGADKTQLHGPGIAIKVTIRISDDLLNHDQSLVKDYKILRLHTDSSSGKSLVDILDGTFHEATNEFTFETDKFSTYALIYKDISTVSPTVTEGVEVTTTGMPTVTGGAELTVTETPTVTKGAELTATETPTVTKGAELTVTETPTVTKGAVSPTGTRNVTEAAVSPTEVPKLTLTPKPVTPSKVLPKVPTRTPAKAPTKVPTKAPKSTVISKKTLEKNALVINAKLKVSQTGSKINVSWGKVSGAEGYDVYVQYCGKKFTSKSLNSVNSGKVCKITITKVNGKKLNLKNNFKIYVVAYKKVGGKKVTLGKTITAHIVGRKNKKNTNVKAVKVKKASYTLKVKGTATIQARTILVDKKKKPLFNKHAKQFRYATTNKKVATVSSSGKIKAVGKGSCIVYVYARNGYAKKIKVKVK